MAEEKKRRFYECASIAEDAGGFTVCLDGRPVRTPARAPMTVPSRLLAEAIRDEWSAQGDAIEPARMPLLRLANVAVDFGEDKRPQLIEEICKYAGSDLLCYRAASPEELAKRQAALWQPLLDWLENEFDILLQPTEGIMAIAQPDNSLARLATMLRDVEIFTLYGVHQTVTLTGSAVLGVALLHGRISVQEAFDLSLVDDVWQAEQWGLDDEAEARRNLLKSELEAVAPLVSPINQE